MIMNQTDVSLLSYQGMNDSLYSTYVHQSTEIPSLLECDLKREIEKVVSLFCTSIKRNLPLFVCDTKRETEIFVFSVCT